MVVDNGEVKVPCSPVNNIEQVFDDPHVKHRSEN